MRTQRLWGSISVNTKYDLHYVNGKIKEYERKICFNDLMSSDALLSKITLYKINCKTSFEYRDLYLNYITEMLQLEDTVIGKDSFTFKAYPCNIKNALVLTLLRFLYETFARDSSINLEERFIKPLLNGECTFQDKLKRFCYFYVAIEPKDTVYFHTGHCWQPCKTKYKSTQSWLDIKELDSVNQFFTKH